MPINTILYILLLAALFVGIAALVRFIMKSSRKE